jgi:hypothetical protein
MGSLYLAHKNGEKQLELRTHESSDTYLLTVDYASTAPCNNLRYRFDKENMSATSSDSKYRSSCIMYWHKMGNISRKEGITGRRIRDHTCIVSEAPELRAQEYHGKY